MKVGRVLLLRGLRLQFDCYLLGFRSPDTDLHGFDFRFIRRFLLIFFDLLTNLGLTFLILVDDAG